MKNSITAIVSAYNEEKNLHISIRNAIDILTPTTSSFELLIFNDGSSDRTGEIADELQRTYPAIVKVTHNNRNLGLAGIARLGIRQASKEFITWFPGDNSIQKDSLPPLLAAIGEADLVIAYMENVSHRSPLRKNLSRAFTLINNGLFGLHLRYYNGPSIYPAHLLKSLTIKAEGHTFFAEMIIKLIKSGKTYTERPFSHNVLTDKSSKSITLKNIYNVHRTIAILILDGYFSRNPQYQQSLERV